MPSTVRLWSNKDNDKFHLYLPVFQQVVITWRLYDHLVWRWHRLDSRTSRGMYILQTLVSLTHSGGTRGQGGQIPYRNLVCHLFASGSKFAQRFYYSRWPIRDMQLFFLFPRFSCQVSTTVETLTPWWKPLHCGKKVYTAVETFSLRWKRFLRGVKDYTTVKTFSPRWKRFPRGGNVSTVVYTFTPRWKRFHRDRLVELSSGCSRVRCFRLLVAVGYVGRWGSWVAPALPDKDRALLSLPETDKDRALLSLPETVSLPLPVTLLREQMQMAAPCQRTATEFQNQMGECRATRCNNNPHTFTFQIRLRHRLPEATMAILPGRQRDRKSIGPKSTISPATVREISYFSAWWLLKNC